MSEKSRAQLVAELLPANRSKYLASLSADGKQKLAWDLSHSWEWIGRPSQQIPKGEWVVWLILAGRGFGKTRTGAETVRHWVKSCPFVNLIGATADDARDIMIEGESGILAICPPEERPLYIPSKRRLEWPNGAVSLIFTADEPERLRGKQHGKLWADELAAWRYADAWDQAMFGLRLGDNPQAVVTTTPRPTEIVRVLVKSPSTVITRGSTYDNAANLAKAFLSKIVEKYEGTRIGRQELNAEILDDNPGALWKRAQIDATRISPVKMPRLVYVAVGVDPGGSSAEGSDQTGIVAVGRDAQQPPHYYAIGDYTLLGTPAEWGAAAVKAYDDHEANKIVAEKNYGGEMVGSVIHNTRPGVPFDLPSATRGKDIRAEPVSLLYEQGRFHHVGHFPKLEDEMCEWVPGEKRSKSPNRMDALVWGAYGCGVERDKRSGSGWMQWLRDEKANAAREADE